MFASSTKIWAFLECLPRTPGDMPIGISSAIFTIGSGKCNDLIIESDLIGKGSSSTTLAYIHESPKPKNNSELRRSSIAMGGLMASLLTKVRVTA
jgi:hypothetical protein